MKKDIRYMLGVVRRDNLLYAEFETDKFDPKKLKFYGSDVEGELSSDSVEYDGNELDNEGGDTTGKASGYSHVRSMTQYNSMIFNIPIDPDEASSSK